MSNVAFSPDEFTEAVRDFRGQIVRAEYKTPWTYENSPFGERVCVRIEIVSEQYQNPQYEWYQPSRIAKTKEEGDGSGYDPFMLGYATAAIDGEGYMGIYRTRAGVRSKNTPHRYLVKVVVTNNNYWYLMPLMVEFGGTVVRDVFTYKWNAPVSFIRSVLPLLPLTVKKWHKEIIVYAARLNERKYDMKGKLKEMAALKDMITLLNKYGIPISPSSVRWFYFIKALHDTGAMKDIKIEGNTDDERIRSLCEQLVGMEFHWTEFTNLEGIRPGRTINRLLLPVEYYGKAEVKKPARGDVVTERVGGID